jgi:hypothetical protein
MTKFILVSKGAITKKTGITYGILFVLEALLLFIPTLVGLSGPAHLLSLFLVVLFLIQAFGCFLRKNWSRWLSVVLGVATILMSILMFVLRGQFNFIGLFLGYIFIRYASLNETNEHKNPIYSGQEFSKTSILNWIILVAILVIPITILILLLK